jgi:hypothetical protein
MEYKMRKFCQLIVVFALLMGGVTGMAYSQISMSNFGGLTVPQPFDEIGQQEDKTLPAISTGYYFLTDGATATGMWKPGPNPDGSTIGLLSEDFEPNLWYKIYSGPRQVPVAEVESGYDAIRHIILPPPTGKVPKEGYRYFRNPAQYSRYLNKLDVTSGIDTVDNAVAGPIPIGFAFYMNGIRYDSFYVSPKGIIALTNRRYMYDADGKRAIPPNKTDCYDPMSADWPFPNNSNSPTQGRRHLAPGSAASLDTTIETTLDNYGWMNVVLGGDPLDATAGIRNFVENGDGMGPGGNPPSQQPSIYMRLNDNTVAGGAYITPLEGPFYLPQYDPTTNSVDNYGQVWYKRSMSSDKLIIQFRNLTMVPGQYQLNEGGTIRTYTINDGRPDVVENTLSGWCQVELNRIDSSITFRYDHWRGYATGPGVYAGTGFIPHPANNFMHAFASIAIGGYARHKGYNTKDVSTYERPETDPWAGQYVQYTQYYNGNPGSPSKINSEALTPSRAIKFKQWKNS